jgi:hypothetical protein
MSPMKLCVELSHLYMELHFVFDETINVLINQPLRQAHTSHIRQAR